MTDHSIRALVIMNADALHGSSDEQAIEQLRSHLARVGIAADIHCITATTSVQHLTAGARQAHYNLVVAAGGDGTVQQVAACLMGTSIPLGVLPLGTMNNVAFNLGIPEDLEQACQILTKGHLRQIDMGLVNGRPFLEVVTIGAATEMAGIGEATRHQGLRGVWQGVMQAVQLMKRLRRSAITLTYAGHRTHKYVWEVTIVNMPIYGLRFTPAASARMDDGFLDVILTRHPSLRSYLWYYVLLLFGKQQPNPQIQWLRVRTLDITSPVRLPIAMDDYPIGLTPAHISIIPHALTVMMPAEGTPLAPRKTAWTSLMRSIVPPTAT